VSNDNRQRLLVLISILTFGLIAIGSVIWYRSDSQYLGPVVRVKGELVPNPLGTDPRYLVDLAPAEVERLLELTERRAISSADLRAGKPEPKSTRELIAAEAPETWEHLVATLVRKYPFQSLEQRLSRYTLPEDSSKTRLSSDALFDIGGRKRITNIEGQNVGMGIRAGEVDRGVLLQSLHEKYIVFFVEQAGFGIYRMGRIPSEGPHPLSWKRMPTQELTDLSKRESGLDGASIDLSETVEDETYKNVTKYPSRSAMAAAHRNLTASFVNEPGWGYVRSVKEVAGFESHRVGPLQLFYPWRKPFIWEYPFDSPTDDSWQMENVQLVGLLKQVNPVVYVTEKLPNMDEIKNAETRSLTDWEDQSLVRLLQGEQVVIDAYENAIHMLGAIRASDDCLHCHAARSGDMLGAFTYRFTRNELPSSTSP
jgi:hypothetical protein